MHWRLELIVWILRQVYTAHLGLSLTHGTLGISYTRFNEVKESIPHPWGKLIPANGSRCLPLIPRIGGDNPNKSWLEKGSEDLQCMAFWKSYRTPPYCCITETLDKYLIKWNWIKEFYSNIFMDQVEPNILPIWWSSRVAWSNRCVKVVTRTL